MSDLELKARSMERLLSIDFIRTPDSSRIYALGHTGKSRMLYVLFQNGNAYKYLGITITDFKEIAHAQSVGKKFQELVIKPSYPYKRVFLEHLAQKAINQNHAKK